MGSSVLIRLTALLAIPALPLPKQRRSTSSPLSVLVHSASLFGTKDLKAAANKQICSKVGKGNKKVTMSCKGAKRSEATLIFSLLYCNLFSLF